MVELLSVMAIMGILIFLVVPASSSLLEDGNMAYAGRTIGDELAVARQYAASLNQTVYVRFINVAGSTYAGFNAVQIFRADPANPGSFLASDRAFRLPSGIEISAQPALSPLLTTLVKNGTTSTDDAGTMPAGSSAPGTYVYFAVRPDGNVIVPYLPTVDPTAAAHVALASQPSYFLTVLPVRYDASTTLPKNYVTIEVNPDTGNTQFFRP